LPHLRAAHLPGEVAYQTRHHLGQRDGGLQELDSAHRKEGRVKSTSIVAKFYQDGDSCDKPETIQELTVFTEDAGAGPYLCLQTVRWAIDVKDIDELVRKLREILELSESE
jgi:hypothetical protein